MFGFIIGTVCLIGLVKMARHGRCGSYGACGGGGGCGGCGSESGACGRRRWGCGGYGHWGGHSHGGGFGAHGPWSHGGEHGEGRGGPWFVQRFMMRKLFERLESTPGQEKVIQEAFETVRDAARKAREDFAASRGDVARAFGGETLDESALGAAHARHDEIHANVRRAVTDALAKVHQALDERQRKILAELIASGPGSFGGGFRGPYRF